MGRSRRGQAGLEFLLSYGWAFLISVVVIRTLVAMNVFNPSASVGEAAVGFGSFEVDAWAYDSSNGNFTFDLRNKIGSSVTITSVTCQGENDASPVTATVTDTSLKPNEKTSVNATLSSALNQGDQFSVTVKITYVWQGKTKFDEGVFSGKAS